MNFSTNEIGIIGETLPQQDEFFNIINLNKIKHNFEVFDFIARRNDDDGWWLFSAKARNKYSKKGKLNTRYNVLTKNNSKKFKKAIDFLHDNGFCGKFHYCFLIAPIEENKDCIYYWGEFTEIKPDVTECNILNNKVSYFGIPVKELTYKIFGVHTWETILREIVPLFNKK